MPSIFLSHTSIDKPFVEKLAKDLKGLGINVWFDRWEIKVGDSITWKIENGIKDNEYLGVVLSKEALESEWVKSEVGAAFMRQMKEKRIVILPIFYRECEIPNLLADRKYADFTKEYEEGLNQLINVFGIVKSEVMSESNWRMFVKKRNVNWQHFRIKELQSFVTNLVDLALDYNWNAWIGDPSAPFTIRFSTRVGNNEKYVTFKLKKHNYSYWVSLKNEFNPNKLIDKDFDIYIGNSINYCSEYLWRIMEDFKNEYGSQKEKSIISVHRRLNENQKSEWLTEVMNGLNWYQGTRLIEMRK